MLINKLCKIYLKITLLFSNLQSLFIFLLRLTWGHQFFLVGAAKFAAIDKTISFFSSLDLPFPVFSAYLVASIETFGGLSLMFGIASRFWAFLLSIIMVTAYLTAHQSVFGLHLIWDPHPLVQERPFAFLLTSLIILIFGPGKIAFDGLFKRWYMKRKEFYHF